MDANSLGRFSAARVIAVRFVFILVLFALALGVVLWRAPLWVGAEIALFRLLAAGFHKRSMVIDGYHVFYIEGGPGYHPITLVGI
jgi:hypothetical protein